MSRRGRLVKSLFAAVLALRAFAPALRAAEIVRHPFRGVTTIARTETAPRNINIHVVEVDLTVPGIHFKVTSPAGGLETIRQTTLDFVNQEHAQLAINGHFFLPFPSTRADADLIGLAASNGTVYSACETPVQSYAIVEYAPAVNIDRYNHASIVHCDRRFPDGKHVQENATLWNVLSGSAQIITDGLKTIPSYAGPQNLGGALTPGGPGHYSATSSWYDALQARTAIGLSQDNAILYLFTVDRAGGSLGMTVGEVAELLLRDYHVHTALSLDGAGSTSIAMADPVTHAAAMVNRSSDRADGRAVGSSLAVFAQPARAEAARR